MSDIGLSISAVVVTYNRPELLEVCVNALLTQTLPLHRITIVDNASECETQKLMHEYVEQYPDIIYYLRLNSNRGGAGGFYAGLKQVVESNTDYAWIMDDDACPNAKSLESLMKHVKDKEHVYGSTAVGIDNSELCWPLYSIKNKNYIRKREQLDPIEEVSGLPFLGLLVPRKIVEKCGLPDTSFFISGDDFEYCQRIRKQGFRIFAVRDSYITHPLPDRYCFYIFGSLFVFLIHSPWKRYYETRNRIFIAGTNGMGAKVLMIPSSLLRLLIAIATQKDKMLHASAILAGLVDGFRNRRGVHESFLPGP